MKHGLDELLRDLNPQQQAAVRHGREPLLIVAGAGTGKTTTLVHRVARLIAEGADPRRILLLTFTRRASAEMIRRVDGVVARWRTHTGQGAGGAGFSAPTSSRVWGGTFHAVAMQLLRMHGASIGLEPHFTIHDRGDSEDLMDVARSGLDLVKSDKRFPRKSTCMAIYSRCINSRMRLEDVIEAGYPTCEPFIPELKKLFLAYIDLKAQGAIVDYDDLLLFWLNLLEDEVAGDAVRRRFDCVLVDEYQDTNVLQSDVLKNLRPGGEGLTVVGDDAQSIYSFRAATIRNILDFPTDFPGATVLPLEQNYRSTQPLLDATNAVIAQATERLEKKLWTTRTGGERPQLVSCGDEDDQADFIVRTILDQYEAGV
ncbi:MAG TPA: ATP-dependent helicase, partial [Pirellulales bacterium]